MYIQTHVPTYIHVTYTPVHAVSLFKNFIPINLSVLFSNIIMYNYVDTTCTCTCICSYMYMYIITS